MSFVLVTADFPEIAPEAFEDIFRRLEQDNWVRLHDHALPVNTIWCGALSNEADDAVSLARHSFTACCIPHCVPRLALERGIGERGFAHS